MSLVHEMVKSISEKKELLDNISEQIRTDVGPCVTLKTMGVERQPWYVFCRKSVSQTSEK